MKGDRCPGQSVQRWTFRDIYTVACPQCRRGVEFFRDDPSLRCPWCGIIVANPKIDEGCYSWCSRADECRALRG